MSRAAPRRRATRRGGSTAPRADHPRRSTAPSPAAPDLAAEGRSERLIDVPDRDPVVGLAQAAADVPADHPAAVPPTATMAAVTAPAGAVPGSAGDGDDHVVPPPLPADRPRRSRAVGIWWWLAVLLGVAGLACGVVPVGPDRLPEAGATLVAAAYTWALAARTGGRAAVFAVLALALGATVVVVDDPRLHTGAAVMTCVISAVLAVMVTVPARTFWHAARETTYAVLVAALGAVATVGFAPSVELVRFEYATLGLSLLGTFALVHRLGAGLHGLGRRGIVAVVAGLVVLAAILAYAEMLRRYGPGDVVSTLLDGVRWSRDHLGAFPRPLETALGVPALAWGTHMRARRRQGWWVCAFGAAGTASVANALVNPGVALDEVVLSVGYGLVVGLAIGFVVIRLDLALTGPRGRRARRAEEAAAVRPEPPRTRPLL